MLPGGHPCDAHAGTCRRVCVRVCDCVCVIARMCMCPYVCVIVTDVLSWGHYIHHIHYIHAAPPPFTCQYASYMHPPPTHTHTSITVRNQAPDAKPVYHIFNLGFSQFGASVSVDVVCVHVCVCVCARARAHACSFARC